MLDKGERFLFPISKAVLSTEAGRKLLFSEAATQPLAIFAVSLAALSHLALVLRLNFNSRTTVVIIGDCYAFLRVLMFTSLLGTFVHERLPWITYAPLIFLPLLLLSAIVRIVIEWFSEKPLHHKRRELTQLLYKLAGARPENRPSRSASIGRLTSDDRRQHEFRVHEDIQQFSSRSE